MKKTVIIQTRFEATHCWPNCPHDDVAFLRHPHRHEFWIEVEIEVSHNDRDVEFIKAKRELDSYLAGVYRRKDLGSTSCEELAEKILTSGLFWHCQSVTVLEDGENGAKVSKE